MLYISHFYPRLRREILNWWQPPSSVCSWSPWCRCRPKRVPCHQTPACKQSPGNQIWEGSKIAQSRIQYILYNLSWCSLPPSWKDLRQGWHSLACTGHWQPREPWTQPEISLSLTAQLEPRLLSQNLFILLFQQSQCEPCHERRVPLPDQSQSASLDSPPCE